MYIFFHQELENVVNITTVTDEYGSSDKLYFPWSPQAGRKNWTYPYIDIFYFDENFTHIWLANYDSNLINDCSISKSDVFPLVWRPFGRIWLPVNFLKTNMFSIYENYRLLENHQSFLNYFDGQQ